MEQGPEPECNSRCGVDCRAALLRVPVPRSTSSSETCHNRGYWLWSRISRDPRCDPNAVFPSEFDRVPSTKKRLSSRGYSGLRKHQSRFKTCRRLERTIRLGHNARRQLLGNRRCCPQAGEQRCFSWRRRKPQSPFHVEQCQTSVGKAAIPVDRAFHVKHTC